MELGTNSLAYYTKVATNMETGSLLYSIRDVKETLELHRDKPTTDNYVAKLLAEFDAYTVELYKRQNKISKRA